MAGVRRHLVWLTVGVLLCFGLYKGGRALDRALNAERYRGLDIIAEVHVPGSWDAPGGDSDQYYPADSREPPFKVPYDTWTSRYWASNWSLAGSFGAFDAAARTAGWQPGACPGEAERRPTKIHDCWQRPSFVLTADFDSTDGSCNPDTQNCGTNIDVELAERDAQ